MAVPAAEITATNRWCGTGTGIGIAAVSGIGGWIVAVFTLGAVETPAFRGKEYTRFPLHTVLLTNTNSTADEALRFRQQKLIQKFAPNSNWL
jgi:hypothetical protein